MENKNEKIIAGFELVVMIVSVFAFAHVMATNGGVFEEYTEAIESSKDIPIGKSVIGIIFEKLKAPMIPFVSSSTIDGCCFMFKDGQKCGTASSEDCAVDSPFSEGVSCLQTSFCQKGCCYDEGLGIFDKNVLEADCSADWVNDPNCNLPGAKLGCCILGTVPIYETEMQCEIDTLTRAMGDSSVVDWDGDMDEGECLLTLATQNEGACILAGGVCKFVNEADCHNYSGQFNENHLCTSSALDTGCEMTEQTTCVEGKDGVYFLDSCGNYANIYDSGRVNDQSYWDNFIEPENACGYDDTEGNANSKSCGNCNRFLGGVCASATKDNFAVDIGDSYCKDTSCVFEGARYENGESWCRYDAYVGKVNDSYTYADDSNPFAADPTISNIDISYSGDVAGSRHWRYVCSQGVVQIEPCADYRNEVCAEEDIGGISIAQCRVNLANLCFIIEDTDRCEDAPDCRVQEVYVDEYFDFDVCVPKYPKGFDIKSTDEDKNGETICGLGTQTCTIVYVKSWDGKWECEGNCDCHDDIFMNEMNDFCISLGDCGGYVNLEEEYDKGFSVSGSWKGSSDLSNSIISLYKSYVTKENTEDNTPRYIYDSSREGGYPDALVFISEAVIDEDDFEMDWGDLMDDNKDWINALGTFFAGGGGPAAVASWYLMIGTNALIATWLGVGDTKTRTTTFTCKPQQPPMGGDDCDICNDPLKPCSEYRCHSLGGACELVNKGSEQEMCVSLRSDGTAPTIEPLLDVISVGISYHDVNDNGFSLTSSDGGCIDAYTPLVFGVTTDKLAYCKFDTEMNEFENMEDFGNNLYLYNHTRTFSLPDPSHGQSQGLDMTGELTYYIKCADTFGHESPGFYTVDMCVNEGPDVTAPIIRATEPASDALVGFDVSSRDISVITNELATCRWNLFDTEYSLMLNEIFCIDEFGSPFSSLGYTCLTELPITKSENTYYIRCMDQPWLTDNNERNANTESLVYALRKPEKKIEIDWIEPSKDFESITDMTTMDLRVQTSGGGEEHDCSFSFSGYNGMMIEMLETGTSGAHAQPDLNRQVGNHTIYIECKDETGDFAQGVTEFEIIRRGIDIEIEPIEDFTAGSGKVAVDLIVRTSGGGDEHNCSYSLSENSASVEFEEQGIVGVHEQKVNVSAGSQTIYVQCWDEAGNTAGDYVSFKITQDTTMPQVARVWQSNGKLYIITIEDAECKWTTTNCEFDWDDGESAGSEKEHIINVIRGDTYYIKCKDKFENVPSGCSIKVGIL